jgi:hypothetical protein
VTTLRPLGLGELMDRSISFWRQHWRPLFQLAVAFQLAQLIVVKGAQLVSKRLFPLFGSGPDAMEQLRQAPAEALPQVAGFSAALLVAILGALFISQVAGVATSHFTWARLTGARPPSPGDAFRRAAQRLGDTAGAYALSLAWALAVSALMVGPGIGLAVGAVVLAKQGPQGAAAALGALAAVAFVGGVVLLILWFILRFILLSQVLAAEDGGALEAFRRAGRLASGRVGGGLLGLVKVRLTIVVTVLGGILLLVSLLMSLPTFIAGAIYGVTFQPGRGLDDVVPAVVLVPIELLQTVGGSLVAPLYVVFQVMFYGDMRARREGLDLELALEAASR